MEEKAYRQIVDEVFTRIDRAFENVDPDLAECAVSQGTLTILFQEKLRFIVSPQTPVRQIWVAFRDRAWHLDRNPEKDLWFDDRGEGTELYTLIENTTREIAGVNVAISRPAGANGQG